jgi:phage terminase large subunit-like protein
MSLFGALRLVEDDRYFFDAEAGDRAVRFCHTFLRHWEGDFAGQPFILLDWQQEVTRTLFGWKRRADGLRRFREVYILTAKSGGKTPFGAFIGTFMLVGDGEPAAHVISAATNFTQASLTFDTGKKYVVSHPKLKRLCDPKQYEIRAQNSSKWQVMSGSPEGRHGLRPSCLLLDEAAEWPNGELYNALTANTTKRSQPLVVVMSNAGKTKNCFAWKLHERALKVRDGKRGASESLLPVIFEAPESLQWDSEEAARAANPSLGKTITFDRLAPEIEKAREDPKAEGEYRRLYLSQWPKIGGGRWLDMALWEAAEQDFNASGHCNDPLYIGLDLSAGDDLCAAGFIWVQPEKLFVGSHFWMPKVTAERYQSKYGIPYLDWAEQGHVELFDHPVIGGKQRRHIAAHIIEMKKRNKLRGVFYDAARADEVIATLEGAGILCVPIRQGYSLSPGCYALENRLSEGPESIAIAKNPVLRFCAENVEVTCDTKNNIWPVKPAARGQYAGERAKKVDGITALVTALVEARKCNFPKKEAKVTACLIGPSK